MTKIIKPKFLIAALLVGVCFHTAPVFAGIINIPPNFLTLNSGLVGWWTMDGKDTVWTSDTAGTVIDKSGNGNTGTLTNMNRSTDPVAGKVGQALYFDGAGNCVVMGNSIIGTNPVTVSFWVHRDVDDFGYIVYNGKFYVKLRDGSRIDISGDGGTILTGTLPTNTWKFITITRDASGNTIFYSDGVSAATGSSGTPTTGTKTLRFGGNDVCGQSFLGKLDDVRIYNRVLSADEVKLLYNITSGSHTNVSQTGPENLNFGLVGWWTMDGKDTVWTSETAGTVIDKSGSGNTGTLTGMNQKTSIGIGKVGQGFKFDVAAHAGVVVSDDIIGTDTTTVCWWSNLTSTGSNQYLFDNGKFQIVSITNNRFVVTSNGGSGTSFPVNSLATNVWQNYCIIRQSDGTASTYLNGSLLTSGDSGTPTAATASMHIGFRRLNDLSIGGILDDFRVYDRALSVNEVKQLYSVTSGSHANVSQAGPENLNSGLVGWWTFDGKDTVWTSDTAGTVIDKSGNGNTGTLTNMNRATSPVIGKIGQGLKFGNSSRVIVTNSASLNSSSITISFWAKFPDAVNVYRIIDKPSQYLVRGIGSGSIQFVGSGCGFFNTSSNKVKAGVWQHFTVTGDSSGCKWFIDGVPNTTIGTAYTGSGSSNLSISSITDPYSGSLDDIRIYNRALSNSEVAQIYSLGR